MADVAEVIGGPAHDWLAAQRQTLNGRFRLALRRFPKLEPAPALALVRELIPPLAGDAEPGTPELLLAVYDLLLLHAGRGTLAPGGGSHPGIGILLRETFPKIRHLLLARPGVLPAALSNAVENVGRRGPEFARELVAVAENIREPDDLLDAGVVLAWRLGEPRLRAKALDVAARTPARAVLAALGVVSWPNSAASLLITALATDAWRPIGTLFTARTIDRLPSEIPERLAALRNRLAAPPAAPLSAWTAAACIGNFRGFDGHFDEPPVLLNAGDQGGRHRFWARCGDESFEVDADAFGWVCRPATVDFQPGKLAARRGRVASLLRRDKVDEPRLFADGTFELAGDSLRQPLFARASSFVATNSLLAFTLADSFRIRILTPGWKPL
jgi:hypothetical protein